MFTAELYMFAEQVAVTKRKDEEDSPSSMYNSMSPTEPVVQFQSYIDDNESIVDEVLVYTGYCLIEQSLL